MTDKRLTYDQLESALKEARAEAADWRRKYRTEQQANIKLTDELTTKVAEFTQLHRELAAARHGLTPALASLLSTFTDPDAIDDAAQRIAREIRPTL